MRRGRIWGAIRYSWRASGHLELICRFAARIGWADMPKHTWADMLSISSYSLYFLSTCPPISQAMAIAWDIGHCTGAFLGHCTGCCIASRCFLLPTHITPTLSESCHASCRHTPAHACHKAGERNSISGKVGLWAETAGQGSHSASRRLIPAHPLSGPHRDTEATVPHHIPGQRPPRAGRAMSTQRSCCCAARRTRGTRRVGRTTTAE